MMFFQRRVSFVVTSCDSRLLQRPVHGVDLDVGPQRDRLGGWWDHTSSRQRGFWKHVRHARRGE